MFPGLAPLPLGGPGRLETRGPTLVGTLHIGGACSIRPFVAWGVVGDVGPGRGFGTPGFFVSLTRATP